MKPVRTRSQNALSVVASVQAYKAALALYELPTAYMLIAASQRDPAEYLAELQARCGASTCCLCAAMLR